MSGLAEMAERLRRWDRWRKGEGEYAYYGEPKDYRPFPSPEEPKALGKLIEGAAGVLVVLDHALDTDFQGQMKDLKDAVELALKGARWNP